MRRLVLLPVFALLPCLVWGQCYSTQERPAWVGGFFAESANSYTEVVSAEGPDEATARNKAAEIAISRRSLSTGKRVSVYVEHGAVRVKGNDELTVKSRVIDEYREYCAPGNYRVYLLIQTAKKPAWDFEPVQVTNEYPFSARVFVPGWAQIHRGSIGRGGFFIAGEVALVGGLVAAECLRASYAAQLRTTHDARKRASYAKSASVAQNVRNGLIAGAAAFYVWNVIDGIACKGKKHVVIGTAECRFGPYVTPTAVGVDVALDF